MPETSPNKEIWLIDRRGYWRKPFARALNMAGFEVAAVDDYAIPPELETEAGLPDLVVVVCTAVTAAELDLVRSMAAHGHYILVLVAALTPSAMRELFLAGAYDVTDMPVKNKEFVALVEMALEDSMSGREHKATALAGL